MGKFEVMLLALFVAGMAAIAAITIWTHSQREPCVCHYDPPRVKKHFPREP